MLWQLSVLRRRSGLTSPATGNGQLATQEKERSDGVLERTGHVHAVSSRRGFPLPFGDDILELARRHLIGQHGAAETADGISTGWAGGDHVLDLTLDLGKNVVNDALHLAIRIDADKIPGSLLRAYTQMEIDARARLNPSGFATKAQREEAKEAAKARAAAEAADGRFRRHNHYPVLWDGQTQTLYAGTASGSVLERLQILFRETFDRTLEPITAGSLARSLNPDGSDDHGAAPMILGASPIASASASAGKLPPSPGPATTRRAWTTSATSSSSGSGTRSRTTARP